MSDEPLISTKETVGDYDAIETAKPGEPIFTLQGGDPFSPDTILHWAGLARAAGLVADKPEDAAKLLKKATAAEQVAWAFRA